MVLVSGKCHPLVQGRAKNLAKFSDTCSVRADGLCIGSPRLMGGRKAGNSNMQEFFLHHAVHKMRGNQTETREKKCHPPVEGFSSVNWEGRRSEVKMLYDEYSVVWKNHCPLV